MARMGMDVDLVESAGRELKERAAAIDGVVSSLDKVVNSLLGVWDGPDSVRFVTEWWPEHRKLLVAASVNVAGLAQSALNNAAEQRDISGGRTSGGAAAPSTGGQDSDANVSTTTPEHAPVHGRTAQPPPSETEYQKWRDETKRWYAAGGYYVDAKGAAIDNCTSWVAFRRQQMGLEVASPPGHGYQMAGNNGGTVDGTPAPGSIVSYSRGEYGHVMFVEEVVATNPTSFRVTEMNVGGQPDGTIREAVWTQNSDGSWSDNHGRKRLTLTISKGI